MSVTKSMQMAHVRALPSFTLHKMRMALFSNSFPIVLQYLWFGGDRCENASEEEKSNLHGEGKTRSESGSGHIW